MAVTEKRLNFTLPTLRLFITTYFLLEVSEQVTLNYTNMLFHH